MRPLRWKGQYASGDRPTDQLRKKLVGCLNQLMEAAGQREHCHDMDEFLTGLAGELETCLRTQDEASNTRIAGLYPRLVATLPLAPYGSAACHGCGLCDLAKAQIAEHLQPSLDCLRYPESGQGS